MRIHLLKGWVLLTIIVAINQVILYFLPFTWAEQTIDVKYTYYQTHAEHYNTLFIGTSGTYRQLSPQLFDELADKSLQINSFNLAAPSYFSPKTELLYRNILKNKPANLKYVILEFRDPRYRIGNNVLHTTEMKYWVTPADTRAAIAYIFSQPEMGWRNKFTLVGRQLLHLSEKNFNIGEGTDIINFWIRDDEADWPRHLGKKMDGFYTLDEEIAEYPQEKYFRRYNYVRANPTILKEQELRSRQFLETIDETSPVNPVLLEHFQALIANSESHGVHLILLLGPRLEDEYKALLPVYYHLPAQHKIEMTHPDEYPEFYSMAYTFDRGHMNREGARLYTQALAQKFNQLMSVDPTASPSQK